MPEEIIRLKNLTKFYGASRGIEEVTFEIKKGEVLGMLGPNAAGKTTTIRILTCFMPPTSGSATVAGYDVSTHSLEVRRLIGYLPENVPLYPDMRVREYLLYRAKLKGVPGKKIKEAITRSLEKTETTDVQNQIIETLSRGYKQRVGIAACLISNPPILILDEPTIGLDPAQIKQIRELIRELGGEHTVLLSSHILPEVEATCERVVIINKGRVTAIDNTQNLINEMRGKVTIIFQARGIPEKIKQALSSIEGAVVTNWQVREGIEARFRVECKKETDLRPALSSAITGSGGIILEMRQETPTLEDIFLHLTTKEGA